MIVTILTHWLTMQIFLPWFRALFSSQKSNKYFCGFHPISEFAKFCCFSIYGQILTFYDWLKKWHFMIINCGFCPTSEIRLSCQMTREIVSLFWVTNLTLHSERSPNRYNIYALPQANPWLRYLRWLCWQIIISKL